MLLKNIYDYIYFHVGCRLYGHKNLRRYLPDKMYLQNYYAERMGYYMDFNNPMTFNEKLQTLKLYDRNPLYTLLVDKYRVKEYVSSHIGSEYVIPTLAVFSRPEDIDLEKLPSKFILKCNHNSGTNIICRDKKTFDFEKAKQKLNSSLKTNYYYIAREWPYKNVSPCIFAEELLEDNINSNGNKALVDYKFFCFHGVPKFMYIGADKAEKPTSDFYDMDFNHLPIRMIDPNADTPPGKPLLFEKMCELAHLLSKDIPHVRVDFYCVNNKIYFGEFTFYHNAGFTSVKPKEWNLKIGEWI